MLQTKTTIDQTAIDAMKLPLPLYPQSEAPNAVNNAALASIPAAATDLTKMNAFHYADSMMLTHPLLSPLILKRRPNSANTGYEWSLEWFEFINPPLVKVPGALTGDNADPIAAGVDAKYHMTFSDQQPQGKEVGWHFAFGCFYRARAARAAQRQLHYGLE